MPPQQQASKLLPNRYLPMFSRCVDWIIVPMWLMLFRALYSGLQETKCLAVACRGPIVVSSLCNTDQPLDDDYAVGSFQVLDIARDLELSELTQRKGLYNSFRVGTRRDR